MAQLLRHIYQIKNKKAAEARLLRELLAAMSAVNPQLC
jgi:hypothetical protein